MKTPRETERTRISSNPIIRVTLFMTLILLVFLGRLYYLQVVRHYEFVTSSENNTTDATVIRAVRGDIHAADGSVLATNRKAIELVYHGGEVKFLDRIARLGKFKLPLPEVTNKFEPAILTKDVPQDSIFPLQEWLAGQEKVIEVRERVERVYLGGMAGNLLGYMSQASAKDVEAGAALTDILPKAGLEFGLNDILRGQDGLMNVEVDAARRVVSKRVVKEAIRGKTVTLSINPKLQRAAEKAILEAKETINRLNKSHGVPLVEYARGAIVALNPKTGQVLAFAVGPKYDPNWFSVKPTAKEGVKAQLDTKYQPMFNRMVNVWYPGSTFKLVTASMLLENGFGNRRFQCFSNWFYGGRPWHNWNRFRNMGVMDARAAIANSCNTWYYQSAVSYGSERFVNDIAERAKDFGFGQSSGIELLGEKFDEVPTVAFEKANKTWDNGVALNYSIGQRLRASPLQIARMLATIVNNGERPELTVIKAIDNKPVPPKPMTQISGKYWSMLKEGMLMTTRVGTAKEVLGANVFPIVTAGKTGTAQSPQGHNRDHAWYMGYGPVNNPNLVVVAFFENGVEGSGVALPAVKKVMAAYWNIKLDKQGRVIRQ
jgi:penicillin-binding protein 2